MSAQYPQSRIDRVLEFLNHPTQRSYEGSLQGGASSLEFNEWVAEVLIPAATEGTRAFTRALRDFGESVAAAGISVEDLLRTLRYQPPTTPPYKRNARRYGR